MDAAVEFVALAAADDLGEAVVPGEAALFSGFRGVDVAAADQFGLYLHEDFFWNDCFVIILDVVLRDDAGVLDTLLGKEVFNGNIPAMFNNCGRACL